jgi:predicted TIM-barrel fold metal-dependent hydrolase
MKGLMRRFRLALAATLVCALATISASELPPIADAHMHYNWNMAETYTPEQAVEIWKAQNVVFAVVAGTPPELALRLQEAAGDWVVPIWSPYLTPQHRHTWFLREEVLEAGRAALESGRYRGVGEVHLIPGLGPRRDNEIFRGLVELATEHDVPFMIHTDASSYRFLLPICQEYASTRFVWAHAGGILPPKQVGALLAACPNVWADLTARDPKRYVLTPITDASGDLLPEWRKVVLDYPDRFMVGSDAVWPVEQMHSWFEADSGWPMVGEFLDFHRRWISGLPEDMQQGIRLDNALRVWAPAHQTGIAER